MVTEARRAVFVLDLYFRWSVVVAAFDLVACCLAVLAGSEHGRRSVPNPAGR